MRYEDFIGASAARFRAILTAENERIPVSPKYRAGVIDSLIGLQGHARNVLGTLGPPRADADTAPYEHRR